MNTAREWCLYGMMWAFLPTPLINEVIRWSKVNSK